MFFFIQKSGTVMVMLIRSVKGVEEGLQGLVVRNCPVIWSSCVCLYSNFNSVLLPLLLLLQGKNSSKYVVTSFANEAAFYYIQTENYTKWTIKFNVLGYKIHTTFVGNKWIATSRQLKEDLNALLCDKYIPFYRKQKYKATEYSCYK